jgi:hypothetical protein
LFTSYSLPNRRKAIAAPRDSLDITPTFSRIAEHLSEPVYCRIQTAVEIHKGSIGPQPIYEFLTSNDVT